MSNKKEKIDMATKPKLLYVGTFTGSWVSDYYRESGFKNHFDVKIFDFRKYEKNSVGVLDMSNDLMEEFIDFEPNVVFINKGESIPQIVVRRMKSSYINPYIVAFNGDQRGHAQKETIIFGQVCDAILINNKSQSEWNEYKNFGVNSIVEYHTAADVDVFRPVKAKKIYDVIFVGGNYGDRFPLSKMRLEAIEEVAKHFSVAVAGSPKWRGVPGIHYLGPRYGINFSRAICSARMSFGINAFDVKNYTSNRTWITMATGVPFLCYHYKGMEKFFTDMKDIIVFNDINQLIEKIKYLLDNKSIAKQIGINGRKLIVEKHTYINRSKQLLDLYEKWRSNREREY